MAVMVHSRGAGWNPELYQATIDKAIPDRTNPPAGLLAHVATPAGEGEWQVVDVWESEEAFRAFLEKIVIPAAMELGAPPFDSTVFEVYNYLIP
ncbi:hypothetical protein J1792_20810 [Streptomyces triculaminicus]|uniref:ABM domain-containing protein n=2 Tax=Streptomyces TaxID=1883 RepID=A0A939FN74_9ACTN|nr:MULTISPECIES: hypothetical protein [Streptomyces]MBO0655130.1 hypothetical protein [Streptomyces triculaminicus]QSY51003.1 hypothetical protein J3S04_08905 [Streptomyces griseocarneus]